MRITVDTGRCCGAGQCAMLVPDVFDQGEDDGIVVLLDPAPADDRLAEVRNAEAMCPTAAIAVVQPSGPAEPRPSGPAESR